VTDSYPIIPAPCFQQLSGEKFSVSLFAVNSDPEFRESEEILVSSLTDYFGLELSQADNALPIALKTSNNKEEEYEVQVSSSQIILLAGDQSGMARAIASLIQMIGIEQNRCVIETGVVRDKPRFGYRGYMLDVSRHFFSVRQILKILDLLFLYKVNVFHWHLTDDQGWRFESKLFPKLTEIGSKREYTQYFKYKDTRAHGGFYSQEEIKSVIEYAAIRGIQVIPEIDFPGHFTAAIAAYPELGCQNKNVNVATSHGILNNVACIGNEQTIEFIKALLGEVCEIFPAPLIHLGGDEVPVSSWKSCPKCSDLMKRESLPHYRDIQSYGNDQIIQFLESKGKQVILWNEAFTKKEVPESVICQHWFDPVKRKNTLKEINSGRQTIISELSAYYLDYPEYMVSLKRSYQFDPVFEGVEKSDAILGVEVPLWTEEVPDWATLVKMTLPRLAAMAERGWSAADDRDFTRFKADYQSQQWLRRKLGFNPEEMGETKLKGIALARARFAFIWKLISVELKQKFLYS